MKEGKKHHTPLPDELAAEVLFASDRTCCVCQERGKSVQIHHIDENPANNHPSNLAVLCFECHTDTQIRGGFHRKLDAAQVARFRADWLSRVQVRRSTADELAAGISVGLPKKAAGARPELTVDSAAPLQVSDAFGDRDREWTRKLPMMLAYIQALPKLRREAYRRAQERWDTGVTSEMMQGNYDLVEVLQDILIQLAEFFPPRHFGGRDAESYFHDMTAECFEWNRALTEPLGPGTRGSMAGAMAAHGVVLDLQGTVAEVVSALIRGIDEFQDIGEFDKRRWDYDWSE